MAVVGTADRVVKVYKLDHPPQEVKNMESPLKFQVLLAVTATLSSSAGADQSSGHALFLQHRCTAIFKDRSSGVPTGFALGSIEGRVAIQYVETTNPKDNFTFKCHRSPELNNGFQDIFAVSQISLSPSIPFNSQITSTIFSFLDRYFDFWLGCPQHIFL